MFIGSYQLGDVVPLSVWCRNANQTPASPDDAPTASVYPDGLDLGPEGGPIVLRQSLPAVDVRKITGYFSYRLSLGALFSVGTYAVVTTYTVGGVHHADVQKFEILPGGSAEGNGIAMHFFKQVAADYVLLQTDQGALQRLRNPKVRGI